MLVTIIKWSHIAIYDNIKLSSFNVEGLRGNAPYLETILPFSNILCLQEHWLWHYEQQDTLN
jgi:hypothetical protein